MLVAVARDGYAFALINFANENVHAPPNHPQPHFLKGGDFGCFVPVLFSYLIRFGHTEALLRHEICPKFYTAGFSGQNFCTTNFA